MSAHGLGGEAPRAPQATLHSLITCSAPTVANTAKTRMKRGFFSGGIRDSFRHSSAPSRTRDAPACAVCSRCRRFLLFLFLVKQFFCILTAPATYMEHDPCLSVSVRPGRWRLQRRRRPRRRNGRPQRRRAVRRRSRQVGCIVPAAPPPGPQKKGLGRLGGQALSVSGAELSAAQHVAEQLPGLPVEALQLHLLDRREVVRRRIELDARQQHRQLEVVKARGLLHDVLA